MAASNAPFNCTNGLTFHIWVIQDGSINLTVDSRICSDNIRRVVVLKVHGGSICEHRVSFIFYFSHFIVISFTVEAFTLRSLLPPSSQSGGSRLGLLFFCCSVNIVSLKKKKTDSITIFLFFVFSR